MCVVHVYNDYWLYAYIQFVVEGRLILSSLFYYVLMLLAIVDTVYSHDSY